MTKRIQFTFTVDEDEAMALAQMFKRMGHDDFHRLSDAFKTDELEQMKWGTDALRIGLAEAGYAPR